MAKSSARTARSAPLSGNGSAILFALCALAYIATGIAFFCDPSTAFTPGSPDYWNALAQSPFGRRAFLAAFALAGLLAFCATGELQRVIGVEDAPVRLARSLGLLGFGVTAISYIRILGGEQQRAAAYAGGDEAVRQSIASFSLSLDPQGWIIFGASGLSLVVFGLAALRLSTLPRWVAIAGTTSGALYIVAFVARLYQATTVVDIAAAFGGIVIGPLWWLGLARESLRSSEPPTYASGMP